MIKLKLRRRGISAVSITVYIPLQRVHEYKRKIKRYLRLAILFCFATNQCTFNILFFIVKIEGCIVSCSYGHTPKAVHGNIKERE